MIATQGDCRYVAQPPGNAGNMWLSPLSPFHDATNPVAFSACPDREPHQFAGTPWHQIEKVPVERQPREHPDLSAGYDGGLRLDNWEISA